MLLPPAPGKEARGAGEASITRANCAGQGCPERQQCRRYRVRIVSPERGDWHHQAGQWISADIERSNTGTCVHFVRWIAERKAA